MKIESLSYIEFYKLSDKIIIKSEPARLLAHTMKVKDDKNFKLATIIKNYPADSKQINNPGFDKKYKELRNDKNPDSILLFYNQIVSEYSK